MLAMQNVVSGVNEATGRRIFRLKKPKRQGGGISGFGIIITETRGHVLSPEFGSTKMGREVGRDRGKALKTFAKRPLHE